MTFEMKSAKVGFNSHCILRKVFFHTCDNDVLKPFFMFEELLVVKFCKFEALLDCFSNFASNAISLC